MSDDNKDEPNPKEVVELCEKLSSKAIEICLIILNSFNFALPLIDLFIIKWKDFSKSVLVIFIFIFIICIIHLILPIILRCWRAKNIIKTDKKKSGKNLAIIGIILSIISVILWEIEDYNFANSLNNLKRPCQQIKVNPYPLNNFNYANYYNKTLSNKEKRRILEICPPGQDYILEARFVDLFLGYFSIYMLKYFSLLQLGIYIILKNRIRDGLDGPEKEKIFVIQNVEELHFSMQGNKANDQAKVKIYNNRNNQDITEGNKMRANEEITNNSDKICVETIDSQERNLK